MEGKRGSDMDANVAKSAVTGPDEEHDADVDFEEAGDEDGGVYRRWKEKRYRKGREQAIPGSLWNEVKRYQQGGEFLSGREVYVGWGETREKGRWRTEPQRCRNAGDQRESRREAKEKTKKKKDPSKEQKKRSRSGKERIIVEGQTQTKRLVGICKNQGRPGMGKVRFWEEGGRSMMVRPRKRGKRRC
jgi:hypothetical protein